MNAPLKEFAFTPEGPEPLLREIPKGADYPVEALGPLREAVEGVQGMTQAPVAIPAGSALAVASLAVQGFADVDTLGGSRPLSLYLLTIAASGERKSSCDGPLMSALRGHEADQAKAQAKEMTQWQADFAIHDARKKGILRDAASSKEETRTGAEADLAALGAAPEQPLLPGRTASEPTLEGLFRAFQLGQPSLGLFSDEAGQFLGGHAMNADNRMKTLGGLNSLWDGAPIQRTRAGDGVYPLYGRRLALHLMMQPVVADAFLSDPLAGGLGFLPRCLICEPQSTIGTRFSVNAKPEGGAIWAFGNRLGSILARKMPVAHDTRQTLEPRRLPLSPSARELVTQFADGIERAQAPGGALAHITGAASKVAEQACRIAGVLALWPDLDAREVTAKDMASGISLAQFYLSEASRLASAAVVSAEIARAEALRKWLLKTWTNDNVLVRDVMRLGPNSLRENPKARAALGLLERHGWVVPLDPGTIVDGASRKEAWRVVRSGNVF